MNLLKKTYYIGALISKNFVRISAVFFSLLITESLLILSVFITHDSRIPYISYCLLKVTMCLFFVFFLISCLRAALANKFSGISYTKGGTLFSWYNDTYVYNQKINWLQIVLYNISEINIDFSKKMLASPSGNKGWYEHEISKKFPESHIVVTDIKIPEDHIESSVNLQYLPQENDALNIREYLEEINISTVDYIWDIKGALWHNYKGKKLDIMLKAFSSVLKSSGGIIIDAYEVNNFKIYFNTLKKPKNRKSYLEDSTFQKIERPLKKNTFYKDNFTLIIVGDGDTRMAVLKKK
ncbi:hypothetical protein [Paenibacillus sp. FSL H3-0286]|uniref:hypothetical protein n=1 Tax=Paenibacillus sp. FSL H3-0286 TaxID=2921427 RepID=UPI003253AA1D